MKTIPNLSSPLVEFDQLSIHDIKTCLDNAGYIIGKKDYAWAEDNDAFKYIGFTKDNAFYAVGYEDTEGCLKDGHTHYVGFVYVFLATDGRLHAEYGGAPVYEGSEQACLLFIEKVTPTNWAPKLILDEEIIDDEVRTLAVTEFTDKACHEATLKADGDSMIPGDDFYKHGWFLRGKDIVHEGDDLTIKYRLLK